MAFIVYSCNQFPLPGPSKESTQGIPGRDGVTAKQLS